MKIKCFSLGKIWPRVVEYFNQRYIINSNATHSPITLPYTIEDLVTTWLAYRILEITNSLDMDILDIPLPSHIEHDMYINTYDLIESSDVLKEFEDYLDLMDLDNGEFSPYISIKVDINNAIMVISG